MDRNWFTYHKRLDLGWIITMAWRDSRRNRSRMLLFISSIIFGIAALVAIFSLGDNVQSDIDSQAKTLIGSDLVIKSNRPLNKKMKPILDSLADQRSKEYSFASMIYFIKGHGTRLVQVCALEGDYPYYGTFETTPATAGMAFRRAKQAIVDKTLMLQFNAHVGDSIQIGQVTFAIAGILTKAPGRTGFSTTIAPPVYIPFQYLEQTGLLQKGSRVSYNFYFKYNDPSEFQQSIKELTPKLEKEGLDYETVESRKKNTGRAFEDFTQFLTLIGFIALLLGCIGVASSVHVYIREKINPIAILRCLGANGSQAFLIYLLQITGIGFAGSLIGALLGTVVQKVLPDVLKDFLPIELSTNISWLSVGQGVLLGILISLLFGLLPLLSIRKISPLYTLRLPFEQNRFGFNPFKWLIYLIILLFVTVFAWRQLEVWEKAIFFTAGILLSFFILTMVAWLLRWFIRRFSFSSWKYLWRQGFANLYRPNNQTLILVVSIGLGTTLIGVLYFVHTILVDRVALTGSANQPNIVLFDIQTSQEKPVADLAKQYQLPILQQVPIVTMRIVEINGKNAVQVKQDTSSKIPRYAFESEFRVTYRETLTETEKLTEGKLGKRVNAQDDPIYVSLEEGNANWLHVKVGDRIVFNVQGTLIPTVVGSIRQVDWRRVQTNFRIIFPPGVLEESPQFHVLVSRVPSPEVSARFQQAVVRLFPNVSIIDLGLILSVLEDVLDKIGFVIRFMAAFSIITGLIVLIASILISKYQRIQETVLLRTLGASRKQILIITALEYFFLGALAAATGIILSLLASWGLAKYYFDASFSPSWIPVIVIFLSISLLTVIIGLFNTREVINTAPLEILRKEV